LKLAVAQLDVVPNAPMPDSVRWIPECPLYWQVGDGPSNNPTLTAPHVIRAAEASAANRLARYRSERLQQVLSALEMDGVDVAVFPEYSMECEAETLAILSGFSARMVIIAGLGVPRKTGIINLAKFTDDQVDPSANVAGAFWGGRCNLISKRKLAAGEEAVASDGARVVEIDFGSHRVRIAIAICKDYLDLGPNLSSLGHFDLAAIPAHSDSFEPFLPQSPRDFPRLFANSSRGGGSAIFLSGMEGVFHTHLGSQLLPANAEGYVVADWKSTPARPTGINEVANRVLRRSAIVTKSDGDYVKVAKKFSEMVSRGAESSRAVDIETLQRWLANLSVTPRMAVLRDAVEAYMEAASADIVTEFTKDCLGSHLILGTADSLADVRTEALAEVASLIQSSLVNPRGTPEELQALLGVAAVYSPWNRALRGHPDVRVAGKGERKSFFAVGLGVFDLKDAERTVAAQLDLLQAFALAAPVGACFMVNVFTREDVASGSTVAECSIEFTGSDDETSLAYFDDLERQVRAIYVQGWSLHGATTPSANGHVTEICPRLNSISSGRENLGVLVDVLRASKGDHTLSLRACKSGEADPVEPLLAFSATLTSVTANAALANLVGAVLFPGGWNCVEGRESLPEEGTELPVGSVANVLHPPDGYIDGRGLRRQRPLGVMAEDLPWGADGALLGSATVAQPYLDREVSIHLPDSSRSLHTYVIGRTGSGKTNTLKNIVRHDLSRDAPVIVIDPHGDLYDYAIRHVADERQFVPLDFGSLEPISVNPLLLDAEEVIDYERNVEATVDLLAKSQFHEWYGPRFKDLATLCILTTFVASKRNGRIPSLGEVVRLIEDPDARNEAKRILIECGRRDLVLRWRLHEEIKREDRAEVEQWLASRFSDLRLSSVLSGAIEGLPTVSIDGVLRNGGVLLVKVPVNVIGPSASSFLGSLVVSRILRYTTTHGFGEFATPASLVVDEFQNFVNVGFAHLIPEARKYNLSLTLANQTLSQLVRFDEFEGRATVGLRDSILGNVGNLIVQSVGHIDAEALAPELGLSGGQVERIAKHSSATVLTLDGQRTLPFTIDLFDSTLKPGVVSSASLPERCRDALSAAGKGVPGPKVDFSHVGSPASGARGASEPVAATSAPSDWLSEFKPSGGADMTGDQT
jgi:hypothetical protein